MRLQEETERLWKRSSSSNSAEMTGKGHCWYLKEKFMCDKLKDEQELYGHEEKRLRLNPMIIFLFFIFF